MNPDEPRTPREEIEVRITALLMGELSPLEAAVLETRIAADPELTALYARLRRVAGLLSEANAISKQTAPPVPAMLSSERREQLLAHFKTVAAPAAVARPRRDWSWVAPLGLAAALIALIGGGLMVNGFVHRKGAPDFAVNNSDFVLLKKLRNFDEDAPQGSSRKQAEAISSRNAPPEHLTLNAGTGSLSLEGRNTMRPSAARGMSALSTPEPITLHAGTLAIDGTYRMGAGGSGTIAFASPLGAVAEPIVTLNGPQNLGGPFASGGMTLNGGNAYTGGTNLLNGTDPYQGVTVLNGVPTITSDDGRESVKGTGNEYQPYPGHPMTTSLGAEFETLLGSEQLYRITPRTSQNPGGGGIASTKSSGLIFNGGTLASTAGHSSGPESNLGSIVLPGNDVYSGGTTLLPGTIIAGGTTGTAGAGTTTARFENAAGIAEPGVTISAGALSLAAGAEQTADASKTSDVTLTPQNSAGGRIAFWTDDETSKINIKPSAGFAPVDSTTASSGSNGTIFNRGPAYTFGAAPTAPLLDSVTAFQFASVGQVTASPPTLENESKPGQAPIDDGMPVTKAQAAPAITGNTRTRPEDRVIRREIASPAAVFGPVQTASKEPPLVASVGEEKPVQQKRTYSSLDDLLFSTDFSAKPAPQFAQKDSLAKTDATEPLANLKSPGLTLTVKPMPGAKLEESVDTRLSDLSAKKAVAIDAIPQPEIQTSANAFSTFSLNVSDVSFKLAAASLEKGHMPEPSSVRSEEFINAFDYRDPEPGPGAPLAFAAERARDPFAQNRDLLRFSVKTAAAGRQPGRPLNIVLLLDKSGSMERADRVNIVREALRVLATQLQPQDRLSIVTFARTPRLWADGVAGDKVGEMIARVGETTPEGGTNLDAALDLGYATAQRHYAVGSINRVVLFTDGAANLGDVNAGALTKKVEAHRKQGIALDCFGIGWEDYNDDLLEQLTRNGDGRYGFINTPEEAAANFAAQLAGAFQVAASDVKVQVEFNPRRVTAYRQIGYAKHQLKKEEFRDNSVAAAQIGAAESGNALYVVEVNSRSEGDLATVRVRFRVPGTSDYQEHAWTVPFTGEAVPLEQASPALRLAGAAGAFAEWLVASPYATEVTSDRLLGVINGVPAIYGADPRPKKLEWMIRQAKSLSGR